ncbi:MAG: ribulose-phosphate 3-epimerase [Actinobacteria bacterium]|jgi:ribulose-phosphate 3-epimerase|nr:ribulose-phosphate 3-epimerase [Actinomycetota bacterium]NDA38488.1 ribulose-phosphate 3-epimerase [Actinomycetota bacterium]NDE12504.1 ribulose-phosphate 3-epimerase [Actinomycetota bacterium]NDE83616.1 ribulose-phosphate 3-epimerase [Actinomycetota bacterium]
MIRICPSILNANFDDLPGEILKISEVSDLLHLDVMDGKFVPNFTFDFAKASAIISASKLPVDVHLMIADADNEAIPYAKTEALSITIHFEACTNPLATLKRIRSFGKRAALAVKPNTPFGAIEELIQECDMILIMTVEPGFGGQSFMKEMLPKVEAARNYLDQKGYRDIWLEVDGGVNEETIALARRAGADTFVAGSAVFKSENPAGVVETLRHLADAVK